MPEPDVIRKTTTPAAVAANEGELKLSGDKIKLVTRPASKENTASSRCALLNRGISRPLSAVPALALYRKDDFDAPVNTKRPFSADDAPHNSKRKLKHIDLLSDLQDVGDSDRNENLPSSELLKNLISEPMSDWKRDGRNWSSSSSDETPMTRTNTRKIDSFKCELTPGLKSKPPLPRKSMDGPHRPDEIDDIRARSLKFDVEFREKADKFSRQEMISEKEFNKYLVETNDGRGRSHGECENDGEDYNSILKNLNSEQKESETLTRKAYSDRKFDDEKIEDLPTSKSDNELSFKNWVGEDTFVAKSEKRTDSYLKSLKTQHEEIDKCINRAQRVLDKTKQHTVDKPQNCDDDLEQLQNYKFDRFFDLDHSKTDRDLPKSKTAPSRRPAVKKISSKSAAAEVASTSKPRFTAKPMRSYRDYSEKSVEEEESWMAKEFSEIQPKRSESKNVAVEENSLDGSVAWNGTDEKTRQTNYLDFLDNVEDLEQATKIMNEIPEHDTDTCLPDANTYDDIAQILEVLEAEDMTSHKKMESIKELVTEELNAAISESGCEEPPKSTDSLRSISVTSKMSDQDRASSASLTSSDSNNYNEILSFLDEVDRNCTKSLVCAKERVHKVTQFLEKAMSLNSIPKKEDLQVLTNDELSDQIVTLNLRLKEKSSSIKVLQDELSALRAQVVRNSKQTEEIVKRNAKQQKEEHEAVVKRHQKFIDQLIADKKVLNKQCEGLVSEMKLLEERYKSNTKAAEHRHHVELQKVKEMHLAGEKIRRERWVDAKTQKIKELTVKSIEPELQGMTVRHQQEMSDLRALHKNELEDLELKGARRTQQQCETLRMQMAEEREKALAHEREIMRQRYEKLVECEEKGYQEQRRRLLQDHANKVTECEEREAAVAIEKERAIKQAQAEFEEKLQAVNRRHGNEIKMLREATELEMEAWKNNYRKQQAFEMLQKEAQLREQCRKERDREIEAVIERLEAESNEIKDQIEQTTENRIRRLKEKFDNEIRDLELSENETKRKYSETRARLLECEDVIIELRATIKQVEAQLKEYQESTGKMNAEKERLKGIVRKEMKGEVEILEKEVALLRHEKDKELQQVYSRVKMAVARKDEVLSELNRDHSALQEKCVYLENMLEQQRKEYLIK